MDRPATFTSTFTPGPILSTLVNYLPFASLRALQLTCQRYADLYAYALPVKYNVDTHLSRWFTDPKALRQMLDEYQGLISGSAALQFFMQPTSWQPDDVDVYCHYLLVELFHEHLLDKQNCTYLQKKTGEESDYPVLDLHEVRYYTALSAVTHHAERIQLIVTGPNQHHNFDGEDQHIKYDPLKAVLGGFHSTVVKNLIMGTYAISLFPNTTIMRWMNYPCKRMERAGLRGINKYTARGWRVAELLPGDREKRSNPMQIRRVLGDRHCWRIDFDQHGVSVIPPVADNPLPDLDWNTTEFQMTVWRTYTHYSQRRSVASLVRIYVMTPEWSSNEAWNDRNKRFDALGKLGSKERTPRADNT